MNSVNIKTVKSCTSIFLRAVVFSFFFFVQVKLNAQVAAIKGDKDALTAPQTEIKAVLPNKDSVAKPLDTATKEKDQEILKAIRKAIQPTEPTNQIVILNTEAGFIPSEVRVRKGESYKIHVVNINMREKNVSFVMDSFTQTHNTVFAQSKSFNIEPQVEGVYSYQCPETGVQGQLVVVTGEKNKKDFQVRRKLASEDK